MNLTQPEISKLLEMVNAGIRTVGLGVFANDGGKVLQEAVNKLEKQYRSMDN